MRRTCHAPCARTAENCAPHMTSDAAATSLRCLQTLPKGTGGIFTARFDPTGRYALTGGADRTVRLWNPRTGLLIQSYLAHSYQVLSVCPAADGVRFASGGGDRGVFLWDVSSTAAVRKFAGPHGHTERVNSVQFLSANDAVVASASYDASVRLWDCRSQSSNPVQVLSEARDSVSAIAAPRGGTCIVTASIDGCVRTYDVRAGRLSEDSLPAPLSSLAHSRDGNCLLVGCLDDSLWLLDIATGESLSHYAGQGFENRAFQLDSGVLCDDAYVVAGSEDGSICFWDIVQSGPPSFRNANSHTASPVSAIDAHPTERVIISGAHSGEAKLWTLQ